MEELRSTDILDQEIRSDVKKRAEEILEKAKEECEKLLSSVDEKVSSAKEEAVKASQQRISIYEKKANASLPLEKQRYFVSYVYSQVVEAMNSYFEVLGESGRLSIIQSLVERSIPQLQHKKITAFCINIDPKDVDALLKKELKENFASCKKYEGFFEPEGAVKGFKFRDGLILKTEDSSVLCRLTLDERAKEILDANIFELSQSLFCGRLAQ